MYVETYRELIKVDSVEGKILVVNRVQGSPENSGLHLTTETFTYSIIYKISSSKLSCNHIKIRQLQIYCGNI